MLQVANILKSMLVFDLNKTFDKIWDGIAERGELGLSAKRDIYFARISTSGKFKEDLAYWFISLFEDLAQKLRVRKKVRDW